MSATDSSSSFEDSEYSLDDASFYEPRSRKKRKSTKSKGHGGDSAVNSGKKTKQSKKDGANKATKESVASSSSFSEASDGEESVLFADPINPAPSMECDDDWEEEVYLARIQAYQNATQASPSPYLITTPYNTKVCAEVWEKLYPYQKEGCGWMYGLYREGVGGVLADEMGLGKVTS